MSLNNIGEEYVLETNLEGVSLDIGLYNSGTDTLSDTSVLSDITSEPDNANTYARQTDTFTLVDESGDYAFETSTQLTFDTSTNTETVDSYFLVANFDSDVAGDAGSATDHLIGWGSLSSSRNLSDIDTLNISSGTVGSTIT